MFGSQPDPEPPREVHPNFTAKQLEQTDAFTDPHGNERVIIAMPLKDVKLILSYLLMPEAAVRFRAMAALEEAYGIRSLAELPVEERTSAKAHEIAETVASHLAEDMERMEMPGIDPMVYAAVWMLERPLVQALMRRLLADSDEEIFKDFQVPDKLPKDFL